MKEWILENTTITEQEYDNLLNINTVSIKGKHQENHITDLSNHPIVNIAQFTSRKPSLTQRIRFKIIKKKDINKKNLYIYKQIKFYIISEFLNNFKAELLTLKRHKQCFHLNFDICTTLNITSYLITALCQSPYYKKKKEYIHTFVLIITNDNQEYIIDGTINTIMSKDTYFNIFKPQIISCIEKEQLKEDYKYIKPLEQVGLIYKAEYYCFKDKVINGIKKYNKRKN